jgi:ribosomal protein L28
MWDLVLRNEGLGFTQTPISASLSEAANCANSSLLLTKPTLSEVNMADESIPQNHEPSKACTRCGEVKAFTCFYTDKRSGKPTARCKVCLNKHTDAYRRANPERAKAWSKKYHSVNADLIKDRTRRYQQANADRVRVWSRNNARKNKLRSMAVTEGDVQSAFSAQGGLCAICQSVEVKPFSGQGGGHLDHCHATMKFRGILCTLCNTAIGKLGDNSDRMLRAAAYVRGELYPWFKGKRGSGA